MKKAILFLSILFLSVNGYADDDKIASKVYEWKDLKVEKTKTGERRHIFKGSTDTLEYLQIHASTVQPGMAMHGAHTHDDREEMIIIKSGTMEHTVNGKSTILPTGSMTLAVPGDLHGMRNVGDDAATYYVIRWTAKRKTGQANLSASSICISWDDHTVKKLDKGVRRSIIRQPTKMLKEVEMHTTLLNEGKMSHPPHVHVEDEIIIVRYGDVEEMLDGKPLQAGPGSVIFLGSNVPHGIRNNGKGDTEYFALKWFVN